MAESINGSILLRLFWFLFFCTLIIGSCVLTYLYGPPSSRYTNESFNWEYVPEEFDRTKQNIMLDTHSHTLYSDGILTVEQNVLWHIANGFNVSIITDHDTWDHIPEVREMQEKYADEIILFAGSEWTTNVIHMNILFPLDAVGFEEILAPLDNNPTYEEIQQAINRTHELGGLVTINHFNWSLPKMPDHPTREDVFDWGADFIEVVNEDTWDQASYNLIMENKPEIGMVAGTDMHSPSPVWGWTTLWVEELTSEAIWEQLVLKNTTVIFNDTGSPQNAVSEPNPAYTALRPLAEFGQLLSGYLSSSANPDWVGISIFVAYLLGGFFMGEIIWAKKPLKCLFKRIKSKNGEASGSDLSD